MKCVVEKLKDPDLARETFQTLLGQMVHFKTIMGNQGNFLMNYKDKRIT